MSTEEDRRNAYAKAMYGPAAPHHMTSEGWETVDAAVAKADEELAGLRREISWLRADSAKLSALEAAGVDNWEGYGEAMAPLETQ